MRARTLPALLASLLALVGGAANGVAAQRTYGGPGTVALVLMGESFRRNNAGTGSGDRETGAEGFEPQRHAVLTQVQYFMLPLVFDCGYSALPARCGRPLVY